VWKPFSKTDWIPGTLLSTGLVVAAWAGFIWTGSIATIWPMFGTANQLLAAVALAVATVALFNAGKNQYAWVTLVPFLFVSVTTLYAGWCNLFENYLPLTKVPGKAVLGWVNASLTAIILVCVLIVMLEAGRRSWRVLVKGDYTKNGLPVAVKDGKPVEPLTFGEA